MAEEKVKNKIITGKVRFSYAHVFNPTSIGDNADKKYSVSIIIPKTDKATIQKINKAIEAAKEEGKTSKFKGKIPANLKTPLRDGDEDRPDDEAYANAYFLNAVSIQRPGVIDKTGQPLSEEEFYSGCYGKVSLTFYPFNANGNIGIAAGLNNLLKTEDGEPLSGRAEATEDFADELIDEDELLD